MHSNNIHQTTDTRRLSPQTTSSSGYHSDLSSTNESPHSIQEIKPTSPEQSNCTGISTATNDTKALKQMNFARLSNFIRKQYERAKSRFTSKRREPPPTTRTCTKATSTTPLSYLSDQHSIQSPHPPSIYKQSTFIEPPKIHSIYVQPLYDRNIKATSGDYTSIHECFSQQPSCLVRSFSKRNSSQIDSQSYRRLATVVNYEDLTTECTPTANNVRCRNGQLKKPIYCQSYYPYRYIHKNYTLKQSTYAPISDFISAKTSAFKPIQIRQRPTNYMPEQIPTSDDPCDLEVAQYFHHTPQWSNPNYFDIYTKELPLTVSSKPNFAETLC